MPISAAFPFASHSTQVEGSRMPYVEQGSGDPILFLHGNPPSSYPFQRSSHENRSKLRVVNIGQGIHFLQEDRPDEIGSAIVQWLDEIQ